MEEIDFRKRAEELIQTNAEKKYFRTGCTVLDCAVGGGIGLGFPPGRIVNFVGDKSSGKSLVTDEIFAKNIHEYKKRLKHNYDDCETGHTFDTQTLYGVNIIESGEGFRSRRIEELDGNYHNFLKSIGKNSLGLYAVDSLDGISSKDLDERGEARAKSLRDGKEIKDSGSYHIEIPAFLSKEFFKTKTAATSEKDALLIIVSQVRENLNAGLFGKKFVRSGGKALDFYAHSCIWLYNVHRLKKNDRAVGLVIRALVDKSKTARPYRECVFSMYFDYGIDDIGSSIDFLFGLRGKDFELTKAAQSISWNGEEINLQNLKEFLEKNDWLELAREEKKEATGKKALSVDWILEWLDKDKIRKQKTSEHFGKTVSRDELIKQIEDDPEMRKELEIRTIAKWEEIEWQVKSQRKRKY